MHPIHCPQWAPRPFVKLIASAFLIPVAVTLATAAFAPSARADDASVAQEIQKLREALETERKARVELERRLAAMERGPGAPTHEEITSAVEDYLAQKDLFEAAPPSMKIPSAGNLIDLSVILDAQFGGSTATDAALSQAIALGDHDPHVRGANVRNEELVVSADVDPYFYGFLDVVYKIDEEGESQLELEEAYGLTTSLPAGLQVKLGQFFTEFGRTNPTHPHAWEFFDTPVILGRIFGGDGWRGQGARVSWIVPTCSKCSFTLLGGFQNPVGETEASFYGVAGEQMGAYVLEARDVSNLTDLAYNVRAEASCDAPGPCGSTFSWLAGLSGGFGPNATGENGSTRIYGADFFLKWKPAHTDGGWPWVAWQTEGVYRDYHADDQVQTVDDGMGGFVSVSLPSHRYVDWGLYSQVVYGFARPWSVGARVDYADSDGIYAGSYWRASLALTYFPSEFSRIRLQLQYDDIEGLHSEFPGDSDANFSVWLGFDFSLGKHGAHKF